MHTAITIGFLLYNNMKEAGWLDDEDIFYYENVESLGEIIEGKVNEFFASPLYDAACNSVISMEDAVAVFFNEWKVN